MSSFDESRHPRGQVANAGQFATKTNEAPTALPTPVVDGSETLVPQDFSSRGQMLRWAAAEPAAGWADVSMEDRETFSTEHCAALADALHARSGWPVVGFGDGPEGVVGWVHAGVLAPGGLIVDVDGLHEPADWADRWGQYADSCGADDPDYDWDAVWVYKAQAFGWGGDGTAFDQGASLEILGQASRVAESILKQWNGRW